ncbi:MAG: two pore domain potassium channel family protein [Chloroflexi bacterium]|nr:MAG: two pore domain potassium channel family protein [Chloroflexota bacterium]
MALMLETLEVIVGIAVVFYILNDIFQSVVVPRPTPARYRLTRWVVRPGWRAWRAMGLRTRSSGERERLLGVYAPLVVVVLLLLWLSGLVFGYGLIFDGLRNQLHPLVRDFPTALYFAGTSVLTIGFGDFVATSGVARLLALTAGGTGLGTIALAISFLFSLYGSFQRREILIVTLDARAGAPPSGVNLLETMAKLGMIDDLPRFFAEWEKWAAEVLDSHMAYPVLAYFRSSHDNESWVSALGAVLDATTLVTTTVRDGPHGPAKMMFAMGRHLVEDLARFFRIESDHDPGVERYEFDQARERLAAAGWSLLGPEESWVAFSRLRAQYAVALNNMAKWWAAPPTQWIGDRSYVRLTSLRHEEAPVRVASR